MSVTYRDEKQNKESVVDKDYLPIILAVIKEYIPIIMAVIVLGVTIWLLFSPTIKLL